MPGSVSIHFFGSVVVVVAGVVDVVTMSSHLFPANPDGQEQIPLTHVPLLRQEKALGQPLQQNK